jgi:hypothetical protein
MRDSSLENWALKEFPVDTVGATNINGYGGSAGKTA